jgi:hypothetical protein
MVAELPASHSLKGCALTISIRIIMTILNKKNLNALAFAIIIATPATSVLAANQGNLGATSSGDLAITMTTEDQIQISNLEDIALADGGSGDFTGSSPACIYRNGTGAYTLTAAGSGADNAFTLSNGGADSLAYTLTYDDGTGAQTLATGTALSGRTGADTASKTCASGNNGNIDVTVAAANINSVPAGTYTGTLVLTVSPE